MIETILDEARKEYKEVYRLIDEAMVFSKSKNHRESINILFEAQNMFSLILKERDVSLDFENCFEYVNERLTYWYIFLSLGIEVSKVGDIFMAENFFRYSIQSAPSDLLKKKTKEMRDKVLIN